MERTRRRVDFLFLNLGHFFDHFLILIYATVAMAIAVAELGRSWRVALVVLYSYSWAMSRLDSYQHHYLLSWVLLCIALFVIIGVWHANVVAVALGFSAPVAAVFVECGLYAYQELKAER